MNTNNLKTIVMLICILTATQSESQLLTIQNGMEKIKNNLENSKKNKQFYDKNLIYILANIGEVDRAQQTLTIQKKTASADLENNREYLKKLAKQEKDLQLLILKEKEKLQIENKQIDQLESVLKQIRNNQAHRQVIIEDYQKQIGKMKAGINAWTDRENTTTNLNNELDKKLRIVQQQKDNWNSQKKQTQESADRWNTEVKSQQETFDLYTQLISGR